MNNLKQTIWVIRAGQNSAAHQLFLDNCLIVLAKQDMGDLRLIPKERSAFYATYASRHSDDGRVAITGIGGKFFRFIHEVRVGDLILYPCRLDKRIYFGEAIGTYYYNASPGEEHPHRRKVRWHGSFQKSALSISGRRELGAARTLFRFTKHVEALKRLIVKHRLPIASTAKRKTNLLSNRIGR